MEKIYKNHIKVPDKGKILMCGIKEEFTDLLLPLQGKKEFKIINGILVFDKPPINVKLTSTDHISPAGRIYEMLIYFN